MCNPARDRRAGARHGGERGPRAEQTPAPIVPA